MENSFESSQKTLLKAKKGLGKGLSSLIPLSATVENLHSEENSGLRYIHINELVPGIGQPRQHFDEDALNELSSSIRQHGVLQPLVVRRIERDRFEIIAGERRWRACERAGLKEVPCLISDATDQQLLTLALVENLQREDLNALEEAEGYRRLTEELGLTQEQVAQAVGKDRTTITNALRLLKLPDHTRQLVIDKRLSMGHARALLALKDPNLIDHFSNLLSDSGSSVRKAESLVQEALLEQMKEKRELPKPLRRRETIEEKDVRRRLESFFLTRVEFRQKKGKGAIVVHFDSLDQLDDIMDRLSKNSHVD